MDVPSPIAVYSSNRCLYLVGRLSHCRNEALSPRYAILEVSLGKRNDFCPTLHLHEHPKRYSRAEAAEYIKVDSGESGAVCVHDRVYCIFGFIPLVISYHMICVTRVDVAARIHGHDILSAKCTSMVPVPVPKAYYPVYYGPKHGSGARGNAFYEQQRESDDRRYRALLAPIVDDASGSSTGGPGGVGWYFSYTYDLTSSLQRQQQQQQQNRQQHRQLLQPEELLQHRFLWNGYVSHPLRQLAALARSKAAVEAQRACNWFVPFIQGFVSQKNSLVPAPDKAAAPTSTSLSQPTPQLPQPPMVISCVLIARRSCNFSGARYLRRGVDSRGNCANEVETEQIISVCTSSSASDSVPAASSSRPVNRFMTSSIVLLRASVPLYWHNISLLSLQPGIEVEAAAKASSEHVTDSKVDLHLQSPAREHFNDLRNRYCASTCSISDTKEKRAYSGAIHLLNLIKVKESKREQALGSAFRAVLKALVPRVEFSRVEKAEDKGLVHANGGAGIFATINKRLAAASLEAAEESMFTDISSQDTTPAGSDSDTDCEGAAGPKRYAQDGNSSSSGTLVGVETADADADHWLTYQAFDFLSYHEEVHGSPLGSDKAPADFRSSRGRKRKGGTVLCPFINRSILHRTAGRGLSVPAGKKTEKIVSPPLFDVLDEYARCCLPHTGHLVVSVEVDGDGDVDVDAQTSVNVRQLQHGVFRANCVDCLDRTNIAQFCYAKEALPLQCAALGVRLSPADHANFNLALMELWTAHGNSLALQYGGSEAMHMLTVNNAPSGGLYTAGAVASDKKIHQEFALVGGLKNVLVAANRYVANASSDYAKQRGIDLLHGEFVPVRTPQPGRPVLALWDLDIHPECCRDGYAVDGLVFNYQTIRNRMRGADTDKEKEELREHERHQIGRVTFGDAFSFRVDSHGGHVGGSHEGGATGGGSEGADAAGAGARAGAGADGDSRAPTPTPDAPGLPTASAAPAEDWGTLFGKALGKGHFW